MATKKKTKKRKAKKRARRALFLSLLVCAGLVVGVLFALANTFCKVAAVSYEGQLANYDMDSILQTADIAVGDNIFSFKKEDIETRLQNEYPLLDEFKVKRILPDRVSITAAPAKEQYVLKNSGMYYVISSSDRLMYRAGESDLPTGVPVVEGVSFTVKKAGDTVAFETEEIRKSFEGLLSEVSTYISGVTYLNLSSPDEITFHVGDKYVVNLGGDYQIDYKLQLVKSVMDSQNTDVRTYLDASIEGKVISGPYSE